MMYTSFFCIILQSRVKFYFVLCHANSRTGGKGLSSLNAHPKITKIINQSWMNMQDYKKPPTPECVQVSVSETVL